MAWFHSNECEYATNESRHIREYRDNKEMQQEIRCFPGCIVYLASCSPLVSYSYRPLSSANFKLERTVEQYVYLAASRVRGVERLHLQYS